MLRVAALQLAAVADEGETLAACLRLIDQAARAHRPDLYVLPELGGPPCWLRDREGVIASALTLESTFLRQIAERAHRHRAHIALAVPFRHGEERVTLTSLVFGPEGTLLGQAEQQLLFGADRECFARAERLSDVIDTGRGRLGCLVGSDGITMEAARSLSLRGAQVLCASVAGFGLDDTHLHLPARAFENGVHVVAAARVGALLSESARETASAAGLPEAWLTATGESVVVAPTGEVLARGPRGEEAVVYAEIELAAEGREPSSGVKRRPELYRTLAHRPRLRAAEEVAAEVAVACLALPARGEPSEVVAAVCEQLAVLAKEGAELCVLPELFAFADDSEPEAMADAFASTVQALARACRGSRLQVVTSLAERVEGGLFHSGVLVGQAGIIARQPQLHVPARHVWAEAGRRLELVQLPWGRLGLLVGEDCLVPELVRVAALSGAHLIAGPCALREPRQVELGLCARAAENRVCMAVATRPLVGLGCVLLDLAGDEPFPRWRQEGFDGQLTAPLLLAQQPEQPVLSGSLHVRAATAKQLAEGAHLLDDRAWWLLDELTRPERTSDPEASIAADTGAGRDE